MATDPLVELTGILQLSITPVALISGIGLFLLSLTNRLGRVVDRARELGHSAPPPASSAELAILFRRARLLQGAVALISASILLAVLMVGTLFAIHFISSGLTAVVIVLFAVCLLCLVAATALFMGDVILGIRALQITLGPRGSR